MTFGKNNTIMKILKKKKKTEKKKENSGPEIFPLASPAPVSLGKLNICWCALRQFARGLGKCRFPAVKMHFGKGSLAGFPGRCTLFGKSEVA